MVFESMEVFVDACEAMLHFLHVVREVICVSCLLTPKESQVFLFQSHDFQFN